MLAEISHQQALLEGKGMFTVLPFDEKLRLAGLYPLLPTAPEILQVNVGKICNQTCRHCHVDAGPDRREMMDQETFQFCLDALEKNKIKTLDITGGAPEMNPHFRWFVTEASKVVTKIMVRCNLTIIVSNPKYYDLPEFFRENAVEVISSLPYFNAKRTDSQRGKGVFERSIQALQMLNKVGYGMENSGLVLNLVYNPAGAFLPSGEESLETEFKKQLLQEHSIHFNELFSITNLPVSRFLEYLIETGKLEIYMNELANAFNPLAAKNLMCKNTISVGWDGKLFDCDFNQMLEMDAENSINHIRDLDSFKFSFRKIKTGQHCYGCTAGAGSGCSGSLV